MIADHRHALACANAYRRRGLTPLPSRMDIKGPMLASYAEHYGPTPVPESVYERWATTNIQVVTGAKHPGARSVVVIDLDGEEARDKWRSICRANGHRPEGSWIAETGSGGIHIYYSLPPGITSCESGMLWGLWDTWGDSGKGKWEKHKEVRLLADRALVIAPPSIHVETGRRYEFRPGCKPTDFPMPAEIPSWILDLPRLSTPSTSPRPAHQRPKFVAPSHNGRYYNRDAVMAAIPDKVAQARQWGLRTAREEPNPAGWVSCYAVDRDDRTPSASIHAEDGTYQDRRDMTAYSFFDLGVMLGAFLTWNDCRDYCGDLYLSR